MAVHVTTEVGKPGRRERERRHFGERRGYETDVIRGRRFIDPGHGDQPDWHPHVQKRDVKYTDHGLDWTSRARYIAPPKHYTGEYPEEVSLPRLRCYPDKNAFVRTTAEWTAYPQGAHIGKRSRFLRRDDAGKPGVQHLASLTSSNEITHTMMLGMNKKLSSTWERRGEIPAASGGDKSYQAPEYSPDFHHYGSTRPVVNFGGTLKLKADTFVPLQDLPAQVSEPFNVKERRRKYASEVDSVIKLNDWTPAPQLMAASF